MRLLEEEELEVEHLYQLVKLGFELRADRYENEAKQHAMKALSNARVELVEARNQLNVIAQRATPGVQQRSTPPMKDWRDS